MTRRQLLLNTDSWELALWEAKQRIDGPINDGWQEDARAARIVGAAGRIDPEAAMPKWDKRERSKPRQNLAEMKAQFSTFCQYMKR